MIHLAAPVRTPDRFYDLPHAHYGLVVAALGRGQDHRRTIANFGVAGRIHDARSLSAHLGWQFQGFFHIEDQLLPRRPSAENAQSCGSNLVRSVRQDGPPQGLFEVFRGQRSEPFDRGDTQGYGTVGDPASQYALHITSAYRSQRPDGNHAVGFGNRIVGRQAAELVGGGRVGQ